jgi:RNA polymerase sigma factor (sigma-70 family)
MRMPSDAVDDLLHAARRGDDEARQRLYAHCVPILRRWAVARLPWPHRGINDADDIVQIALLQAWRRFDGVDFGCASNFFGYLYRILQNEVCAEMRRCNVRGTSVECDEAISDGIDPAVDEAIARERNRLLTTAMRRLDRRQRRHLDMRLRLGMSFGEIATHTGGSADGVRMLIARAVRSVAAAVAAA